jgi:hypothetical protein
MVATHGHSHQNVVFILFDSLIREYNVSSQEKDATNQMAMGVRQTPPTTWPWVFARRHQPLHYLSILECVLHLQNVILCIL